ncbi:MAG: hypothetical protein CBD97_01940 [Pelagibacteraceae bacterium TMED237]|nr:MAG: hypothetical protein CBD97_01940 [Pelagibacteraceae bacterium TMED237]|tara:strand:+ start:4723 stop:5661 length:939 start_codon:yes stop_codon:yes gene_type:complete
MDILTSDLITFGKYKGYTLNDVLKDRSYCKWLLEQEWFRNGYEYLYNRINEYKPNTYFIRKNDNQDFLESYEYFNLYKVDEVKINLSNCEKMCYSFYLQQIGLIKDKIYENLENEIDNPYDIKAPTKWLKNFEKEYAIPRKEFKEFLARYDLINIPYIIERIKKEGGIEYKGAKSFLIAKNHSEKQEKWWEEILKNKYGEDLGTQFKFDKCIFDFLNISTNTIFECKLGLKDFNEEQHFKYKLTLKKYRIIYLIGTDGVIDMERKKIYTVNVNYYKNYLQNISSLKNPSYLDKLIENFEVTEIDSISNLFSV